MFRRQSSRGVTLPDALLTITYHPLLEDFQPKYVFWGIVVLLLLLLLLLLLQRFVHRVCVCLQIGNGHQA